MISEYKPFFEDTYNQAQELDDQNRRFDDALTDPLLNQPDNSDFQELTVEGIKSEQQATVEDLRTVDLTPYTTIDGAIETAQTEHDAIETELAEVSAEQQHNLDRLHAVAQRAIELAPIAQAEIDKLEHDKAAVIEQADISSIQSRLHAKSAEIEGLDKASDIADQPWPLPRALYDLVDVQPRLKMLAENRGILIIDNLPEEQEGGIQFTSDSARRLWEKYGYTHGASAMIAAHLIQHPLHIFMPEEIGREVYSDRAQFGDMDDREIDKRLGNRVKALVTTNDLVDKLLAEEGYKVQTGFRRYQDVATGKTLFNKRMIYRCLPPQTDTDVSLTQTVFLSDASNFNPTLGLNTQSGVANVETSNHLSERAEDDVQKLEQTVREIFTSTARQLIEYGILPPTQDYKMNSTRLRSILMRLKASKNGDPVATRLSAEISKQMLTGPFSGTKHHTPGALVAMASGAEVLRETHGKLTKVRIGDIANESAEAAYTALAEEQAAEAAKNKAADADKHHIDASQLKKHLRRRKKDSQVESS